VAYGGPPRLTARSSGAPTSRDAREVYLERASNGIEPERAHDVGPPAPPRPVRGLEGVRGRDDDAGRARRAEAMVRPVALALRGGHDVPIGDRFGASRALALSGRA
jgi:hypothetical protein